MLVIAIVLTVNTSQAQQTRIPDYDTARDTYFWPQFYAFGGETLYCAATFGPQMSLDLGNQRLAVEHAYPADWIAEALGCKNRNNCDHPSYGFAEADLHNLWPALSSINSRRGDQLLSELPGEGERRFTCICPDYECSTVAGGVVEPRDKVRGEVARSILYMS